MLKLTEMSTTTRFVLMAVAAVVLLSAIGAFAPAHSMGLIAANAGAAQHRAILAGPATVSATKSDKLMVLANPEVRAVKTDRLGVVR